MGGVLQPLKAGHPRLQNVAAPRAARPLRRVRELRWVRAEVPEGVVQQGGPWAEPCLTPGELLLQQDPVLLALRQLTRQPVFFQRRWGLLLAQPHERVVQLLRDDPPRRYAARPEGRVHFAPVQSLSLQLLEPRPSDAP